MWRVIDDNGHNYGNGDINSSADNGLKLGVTDNITSMIEGGYF